MKSEPFRIISYDVNIMYHVSGGPTEQIVAALLTENQLCAVWQDRVPDVYEHGPNNMMLSLDLHTRYARSCEKEGRQPKYIQLGRTINDDQNPQN